MKEHFPICSIYNGKHQYPYVCSCPVITKTQEHIAQYLLNICRHSATVPCWNCVEFVNAIKLYDFKDVA